MGQAEQLAQMDLTQLLQESDPKKKAKKPESTLTTMGGISNLISSTWESLMEDSYGHLDLNEQAFESDIERYHREVKRLTEANKKAKKSAPLFMMPPLPKGFGDDTYKKYGYPKPIQVKYHPLILRDLAEHDPDISASLDCFAVNVGEARWTLTPALPIETYTDGSGTERRRFVDTQEDVPEAEWKKMQAETRVINSFINNLCPGRTFSDVRSEHERDQQELGNDYWQMQRGPGRKFLGVKPFKDDTTIRLCEDDLEPVEDYEHKYYEGHDIKVDKMEWTFCRYVQSIGMKRRYYKSFGDTRFLDRDTGRYYPSADEAPEGAKDATEVWHFKLHGVNYGRPRWVAASYSVQTNKGAQLTNRETMNNSGVPKMIMVLMNCSDETIESNLKRNIRQIKESGSKEMIVFVRLKPESVGVGPQEQPIGTDFRIERLSNQQEKEGLYLEMQKHNQLNIQTTMRLPAMLFGKSEATMNRATAFIMMSTVEKQVFAPARQRFDDFMNNVIFVEKGFKYWRFCSQSGDLNDAELYIHLLRLFSDSGAIIPNEMRKLGPELLDVDLPPLEAEWAKTPKYIATMKTLVDGGATPQNTGGDEPPIVDPNSDQAIAESLKIDLSLESRYAAIGRDALKQMGLELNQADVFVYAASHS